MAASGPSGSPGRKTRSSKQKSKGSPEQVSELATDLRGAKELTNSPSSPVDKDEPGVRLESQASNSEVFDNRRRPAPRSGNSDRVNLEIRKYISGLVASSNEEEIVRAHDGRQNTVTDLGFSEPSATAEPIMTDKGASSSVDGPFGQIIIEVESEPTATAEISSLPSALLLETNTLKISEQLQRANLPTGKIVEVLGKPCSETDLDTEIIRKQGPPEAAPASNGKSDSSASERTSDDPQGICGLADSASGTNHELAHPWWNCMKRAQSWHRSCHRSTLGRSSVVFPPFSKYLHAV